MAIYRKRLMARPYPSDGWRGGLFWLFGVLLQLFSTGQHDTDGLSGTRVFSMKESDFYKKRKNLAKAPRV